MVKRLLIVLLSFVIFGALLGADDGATVYSEAADSVIFLHHELYLDSANIQYQDLWSKLEKYLDYEVLDTYIPVSTGTGFVIDSRGYAITNRHVVDVQHIDYLRYLATEMFRIGIAELPSSFSSSEKDKLTKDVG